MTEFDYIGCLLLLFQEFRRDESFRLPVFTYLGHTGTPNMPTHAVRLTATWRGRALSVTERARNKQDAKRNAAGAICEMIASIENGDEIDTPEAEVNIRRV